jgi:hypothetical protein
VDDGARELSEADGEARSRQWVIISTFPVSKSGAAKEYPVSEERKEPDRDRMSGLLPAEKESEIENGVDEPSIAGMGLEFSVGLNAINGVSNGINEDEDASGCETPKLAAVWRGGA